ncbi:unnamed protein product [Symbiodinium natans]|uniref:Uncharacterized protein n=1 Tax=Symbiodinium natans TaxID=878477 RepID=A0A812IL39_9DINO|nr:unnamed protein product [Symbiodinium natans]
MAVAGNAQQPLVELNELPSAREELHQLLVQLYTTLFEEQSFLELLMERYRASWTLGTPIKHWHHRWMEFHRENPEAGNRFSPGNWFWYFGMVVLLPREMYGRSDDKNAGDFTEGFLMFVYDAGSECRRSRKVFYHLRRWVLALKKFLELSMPMAQDMFACQPTWTWEHVTVFNDMLAARGV